MARGENTYLHPWEEPLDEEYWQALLSEGEIAHKGPPPSNEDLWMGMDVVNEHHLREEPPARLFPSPEEPPRSEELEQVWQEAAECLAQGKVVELEVVGYNRGGLLVDWDGLQGFVPASHLVGLTSQGRNEERQAELARWVGQTLPLKVMEIDRERGRLVLSHREAVNDDQTVMEVLNSIQPGEVRRGRVTNLCDFGAFVDLGGVEGLVHVSEISWSRVNHPSDVLRVGQEVEVYVLNVDPQAQRVGLSLKRLQPDPWLSVEERYHVGQIVEGTITNVVSFGAFARIEDGLEGLIHISELAEGHFLHPRNVVKEGDVVKVKILHIDGPRHRLGLSLRQAWDTSIE